MSWAILVDPNVAFLRQSLSGSFFGDGSMVLSGPFHLVASTFE
jgi:hypothetical protein